MEEKRRHQRYSSGAQRRFVAKYVNNRFLGEVRNFSRGGISFDSNDPLEKENLIKLQLQISGLDKDIPATIEILWSRQKSDGYTYGARLINVNPESKIEILDLLYQDWKQKVIPKSQAN